MQWIDEKFKRNPGRFIAQSLLAFAAVGLITFTASWLANGVIVAALGASAFIVFAMPKHDTAQPRRMVGGHAVCMGIGLLCSVPLRIGWLSSSELSLALVAAAAVGFATFLMVLTNTEHPPAAGNALAFAVGGLAVQHMVFTALAVGMLALVHWILGDRLQDLA